MERGSSFTNATAAERETAVRRATAARACHDTMYGAGGAGHGGVRSKKENAPLFSSRTRCRRSRGS